MTAPPAAAAAVAAATAKKLFEVRLKAITQRVNEYLKFQVDNPSGDSEDNEDENLLKSNLEDAASLAEWPEVVDPDDWNDPDFIENRDLKYPNDILDRVLLIIGDVKLVLPVEPSQAARAWHDARMNAFKAVAEVVCKLRMITGNQEIDALSQCLDDLRCELEVDYLAVALEDLRLAVARNENIKKQQQAATRAVKDSEEFLEKNSNLLTACEAFPDGDKHDFVAPLRAALQEVVRICMLTTP